jgi:hypothetical protein
VDGIEANPAGINIPAGFIASLQVFALRGLQTSKIK